MILHLEHPLVTETTSTVSALHIDNRLIHYEVVGRRGQPIVFLHSWLGSWRYWLPTMDVISERYRAYALDFWGFGESDRRGDSFAISDYVTMLFRFMDNLGMSKVNLVGHGLGGMIAIRAASEQPDRFIKLMTVATPIQGHQLQEIVRPSGLSRLLGRQGVTATWSKLVRQIDTPDRQTQRELVEDTESLSETVIQQVLGSVLSTDLRPDLAKLTMPLLALYSEKDALVAPDINTFFSDKHDYMQQMLTMPKLNHFPFLEQPNTFNRVLQEFLNSQGTPIEIKAEWRRKVSQREYI